MKWTRGRPVASITAALVTGMSMQANADVVNGGFETGDLTGWVQTGDVSFSGVDPSAARSGSFGAFFGPSITGGISQSFATIANATYRVDFSLSLLDSTQPNSFSWTWNGATQSPSFSNAGAFGYTSFNSFELATGPSSTIAFNFRDPQSFWFLDDVAVAAVPELPVDALLGAGLLVMGATAMRRARPRVLG